MSAMRLFKLLLSVLNLKQGMHSASFQNRTWRANRLGGRILAIEFLEGRTLLAVVAGTALEPLPSESTGTTEPSSAVVTTGEDVVDPTDGLVSLREAVEYAKALETDYVSFGIWGRCSLNSPVEIVQNLELSAFGVEIVPSALEGNGFAAFEITGASFSMTGGTVSGFGNSAFLVSGSDSFSLTYVSIQDCSSDRAGGGAYASESRVALEGCSLFGNSASYAGGAIAVQNAFSNGFFSIGNGYVYGNHAGGDGDAGLGGGVAALGAGTLWLGDSNIYENSALGPAGQGGGAYSDFTIFADGLLVAGNCAGDGPDAEGFDAMGGGIFVSSGNAGLSMSNSIVIGNFAHCGGGVYVRDCPDSPASALAAYNCTVAGNSAGEDGIGGILCEGAAEVYNTIAAFNNGGGVFLPEGECLYSLVGIDPKFTAFAAYRAEDWNSGLYTEWRVAVGDDSPAIDIGDDARALKSDGATALVYDFELLNRFNRKVDAGAHENQTLVVSTLLDETGDDGVLSLREAVEIANQADFMVSIRFDESLSGGTVFLSSPLDVYGMVAIDGGGTVSLEAAAQERIFAVQGGTLRLTGLDLASGSADMGGAIYAYDSNLTISDCSVSGCSASSNGGAVYACECVAGFSRIRFDACSAYGDGGAVYVVDSVFSLAECVFIGNSAIGNGGGVCLGYTYAPFMYGTVADCVFTGNSAGMGGGLALTGDGKFRLSGDSFLGNSAVGAGAMGGGIYSEGEMLADGLEVCGNSAGYESGSGTGGGICSMGAMVLVNSLVAGNYAAEGAGARGAEPWKCVT